MTAVARDHDGGPYARRALLREVFEGTPPATPIAGAADIDDWLALDEHRRVVAEFDAWVTAAAAEADRAGHVTVTDPHPNRPWREPVAYYVAQGAVSVRDDGGPDAVLLVGADGGDQAKLGTCPWRDLVLFDPGSPAFTEFAALDRSHEPAHLRARRERAGLAPTRTTAIAAANKVIEQFRRAEPTPLRYENDPVSGPRLLFPVQDAGAAALTPSRCRSTPTRAPPGAGSSPTPTVRGAGCPSRSTRATGCSVRRFSSCSSTEERQEKTKGGNDIASLPPCWRRIGDLNP